MLSWETLWRGGWSSWGKGRRMWFDFGQGPHLGEAPVSISVWARVDDPMGGVRGDEIVGMHRCPRMSAPRGRETGLGAYLDR